MNRVDITNAVNRLTDIFELREWDYCYHLKEPNVISLYEVRRTTWHFPKQNLYIPFVLNGCVIAMRSNRNEIYKFR